ncbi:MAG: MerR family transcriptional regulator [Rhodospirillaceae bacterium]
MNDAAASRSGKSEAAFRTISEVASELDVPQHVLRFWESKFSQVRPLKRGGGRRYYRPEDIVLLKRIRALLYDDGLTIKGVQKLFKDHGLKTVLEGEGGPVTPADKTAGETNSSGSSSIDLSAVLSELKCLRDMLRTTLAAR